MRAPWLLPLAPLMLLAACDKPQVKTTSAAVPAVYCYSSLAKPDCYDAPQPDDRHSLVGYYGPPPPVMPPRQTR